MADTLVDAEVYTSLDHGRMGPWGPYWSDPNTGVIIAIDDANDVEMWRTTDGGATWTQAQVHAGTVRQCAAFYDREPSASGTLIHLIFLDTAGTDAARYITVDVSDGSVGTLRTAKSPITVDPSADLNRAAITKTVNGNLIVAFSTQTQIECLLSTDGGENWTAIADPFETATQEDWLLLFPANTADGADAVGIFGDRSASTWEIKMWDNSVGDWTPTAIVGSITLDDAGESGADGAVRHSDKHILFATHVDIDTTTDDILTFDLTVDDIDSPTVTTKTNVITNVAESGGLTMLINQQNDDVYVAYLKGGTWRATVDCVYHLSTDDMGTWAAESAYSEATADDLRWLSAGRTVDDAGGRWQPVFFNDDLNDIFVNEVNDVEIAAAAAVTRRHMLVY